MKTISFVLWGVLVLSATVFLTGCTRAPVSSVPTISPVTGAPFRVGLLTPGDVSDEGWNQLAYEALQELQKKIGAQISHQVTKNASDHIPALRDFADQKYDLVICHGFEFGERVKTVARDFPATKFVVVGGNVRQEPNVATLVPKLEDATYLLGMVAGGMTKTNKVGLIGGADLPVIRSTFDAFALGAKAVNTRVQVLTSYVGNFEDQNAGKEAARSQIAEGADFLFHNADQAGKGMFVAAREAKGVLVFGSNRDQNAVAPEVTLGSAVIEMPRAFLELARDIGSHKFKAEFRELNLANKDISVHWNPRLQKKIPPALMKKVAAAAAAIAAGRLQIKRKV